MPNDETEGRDPIHDMILESGLDADEYAGVAQALGALRAVVPAEAPAPSPELAALLSGGIVAPLRRTHRVAIAAAAAAAVVACSSVAAAANVLPEGAQRVFSEFSHKYLPFEFPDPAERDDSGHQPSQPSGVTEAEHVDNGNHIGGGTGAGKTDNLGQHKGETKPNSPKSTAGNPGKPTPTSKGKATGPGESKPSKSVTPTPKPKPAKPSPTPRVTPGPDSGRTESVAPEGPGGQGKGKSDATE